MIRPAILTYLRKGKMICQKVYPTLIDTWNYIVSRIDNLKGDQDVNASDGWITVDSTKPTNPVIRFDASKLSAATATSGNVDIKVDAEATTDQKSIDWLELSSIPSLSSDGKALQLYGFDDATQTNVDINDNISSFSNLPQGYVEGTSGLDLTCAGLSDNIEFVCRQNGEIKYYRPVLHLPPLAVPDTVTTGQGGRERTMEYATVADRAIVRPVDWLQPQTFALSAEVSADGGTAMFQPVRDGYNYAISDAKVLCRTENVDGTSLRYANLKIKVKSSTPNLSALNNLSVVTGIEYPMSGTNQYKIVAHRKKMQIVNNVLTLTDLPDQTIDTVAHDTIYPNS